MGFAVSAKKSESLTVGGIIRIPPDFVSVSALACAGFGHIPDPESLCVRGVLEIGSCTAHKTYVMPIHSGWAIVWRMGRRDLWA